MNKPLLLLLGAGCMASCHKEQSMPSNDWNWFGSDNRSVYNYVLINANQVVARQVDDEYHIGITAAFINSDNKLYGVQDLAVNNMSIACNVDSSYDYDFGAASTLNDGLRLYGTDVRVSIRGISEADSVTGHVYLPKKLTSPSPDFPDSVSLSHGLRLTWTPDAANSWGNVKIQLFYLASLSQLHNAQLPSGQKTVELTVPDSGSFLLGAPELSQLPLHGYFAITIARGTQSEAVLPISHKTVYYFTSSSLSSSALFLND